MDSDAANASQNLSSTCFKGSDALEVLNELLESDPNLIEAVTFSKNGDLKAR